MRKPLKMESQPLRPPPVQPMMREVKSMDDFIKLGWYCTFVLVVGECMTLTALASMVYMVYAGISPTVLSCGSTVFNSTKYACESLTVLRNKTGCVPELEYQFVSVNVEFDLLCEDSKLVKSSISVQMIGVLFGALIAGQLSDMFGRKKTLVASLLGLAAFSAAASFAESFFQFTLLRTVAGFFTGGLTSVQGVFLIENIPKKHRMWINTVITWSPNFIFFPGIVYLCVNWRVLAQFTAAIGLLSGVLLCFLFESPRWMIQKGKIERAREVLRRIRHLNGDRCEVEAGELEHMLLHEQSVFDARDKKRKKYTFYHIVCTWKYLIYTLTICGGIFTTSLVNYGLMFNMEKLSGSLYWNNAIFGVIRWMVNIVVGAGDYFWARVGRKLIHFISIVSIILGLAIVITVYVTDKQIELSWIIRYSTIEITAMTSQLYLSKFMLASELFPTAVRNLEISALSVTSRLGTIAAPQLFYLSDYSAMLPYLVLLILSTVDWAAFQLLLPETKGKNLENHLPAKEHRLFYRKPSIADA